MWYNVSQRTGSVYRFGKKPKSFVKCKWMMQTKFSIRKETGWKNVRKVEAEIGNYFN